ncbi:MAG TPA: BTAD domain-containing putative transcriptional regulator, partial [Symbiobacteriaceae bacterium]|nr:BTAD domain-containing putative transcriptional regulator [Symbiobacteriaceae bacterium]
AAICGYILAPAMFAWKEFEEGARLMNQSVEFLTRIDARWQLHSVYYIVSLMEARRGNPEASRALVDRSLALAAAEGYVQYMKSRAEVSAIADALCRGVEVAFCQDVLVRMGERAVPALVELAGRPDPAARRAALYPLARIGGEEAAAAIRQRMYDPDEAVRDAAILAARALNLRQEDVAVGSAPAPVAPASAVEAGPVALQLSLLGPVAVAVGGQVLSGWRTIKARDLIAYLALAGERPVTRDQLMESLWPDTDLESGQALLHTTLYYLRRALKPVGEGLITFAGGAYRLDRDRVAVDLDRFQRLVASGGEQAWREAVHLYRGDLLDGLDYDWVEAPRARARTACMEALRNLSAHLRGGGRPGEAVEWLHRLITLDPLAEEGHIGLMECYAAIGNRNAALQQYRTLVHVLDEELGLEPSREAQELYRKLIG